MSTPCVDFREASPLPAGLTPPDAPLPFLRYIRTVRDNAIAGFHRDVYTQPVAGIDLWRLRTFIVSDPDGIRRVLVDNAANYVKDNIEPRISGLWSESVFTKEDTERIRERRRTMSSSFDYRSTLTNASVILESTAAQFARWSALPPGATIEMSTEMAALTLDIISRIIFASDSPEMVPVMERVFERTQSEPVFGFLDFVPLLDRPWAAYRLQRTRHIFQEMDAAIDRLITRRSRENSQADDLLGRLMRETNVETGSALTPREIRGQIITVVGAGHQSVALALGWIWYLLALQPSHEARLHAELDEVLAGRAPSLPDLARLPWLRMVIEETLRLYPPFPIMAWRGVVADDEICGVTIPKGSTVTIAPWVLHRHTALWDRPGHFDPERFTPERIRERSRYAYLPFGTGPRVCIGASFAMTEIMLIVAAVAQRCRLSLLPGHPVEPRSFVSLQARYGWKMTLKSRT